MFAHTGNEYVINVALIIIFKQIMLPALDHCSASLCHSLVQHTSGHHFQRPTNVDQYLILSHYIYALTASSGNSSQKPMRLNLAMRSCERCSAGIAFSSFITGNKKVFNFSPASA